MDILIVLTRIFQHLSVMDIVVFYQIIVIIHGLFLLAWGLSYYTLKHA